MARTLSVSRIVLRIVLTTLIAFSPTIRAMAAETQDFQQGQTDYDSQVKTLSLDTRYSQGTYSNQAAADFNMEMLQGYGYISNAFYNWQNNIGKNNNIFAKSAWEVGNFSIGILLSGIFSFPVHEFGHATRVAAAHASPYMGFRPDGSATGEGEHTNNFFTYFLMSFKYSFDHPAFTNNDNYNTLPEYLALSSLEQSKIDLEIKSGGLNSEMFNAEEMSNMIYTRGGHVAYLVQYGRLKGSSYIYAVKDNGASGGGTADLTNMLTYYNTTKNYNITFDDIKRDNLIAFFASGTTYALLSSYYHYLRTGDPTVRGLSVGNIRWPDVSLYYTTKGISYKVDSAYRVSDTLSIPFAIEFVSQGESATEVSIGWQKDFSRWATAAKIYSNHGVTFQGAVTYHLAKAFDVSVGIDHYNKNTLYGERHTYDVYKESTDKLWSKLSWNY